MGTIVGMQDPCFLMFAGLPRKYNVHVPRDKA